MNGWRRARRDEGFGVPVRPIPTHAPACDSLGQEGGAGLFCPVGFAP